MQDRASIRSTVEQKSTVDGLGDCRIGLLLLLEWLGGDPASASEYQTDRQPMAKCPQSHAEARPIKSIIMGTKIRIRLADST
jgi:hypothetical protein